MSGSRPFPSALCMAELPGCLRMWMNRVPGLMVIRKPPGPSSFDMIRVAKRLLGVKKIGHSGTLDPIAEGVLVLGVGAATRLMPALEGLDKSYRATALFGRRTDTCDVTGRVLETLPASHLTELAVADALERFRGRAEQVPPMFSALKRNGRPLYELAREGVEVERQTRIVTVKRFDMARFAPGEEPEAVFDIDCSKGTYVRTLIDDLGRSLGVGATMKALVRNRVGPFTLEGAMEVDALAGLRT